MPEIGFVSHNQPSNRLPPTDYRLPPFGFVSHNRSSRRLPATASCDSCHSLLETVSGRGHLHGRLLIHKKTILDACMLCKKLKYSRNSSPPDTGRRGERSFASSGESEPMTASSYLATEDTEATETTELQMNADHVIARSAIKAAPAKDCHPRKAFVGGRGSNVNLRGHLRKSTVPEWHEDKAWEACRSTVLSLRTPSSVRRNGVTSCHSYRTPLVILSSGDIKHRCPLRRNKEHRASQTLSD